MSSSSPMLCMLHRFCESWFSWWTLFQLHEFCSDLIQAFSFLTIHCLGSVYSPVPSGPSLPGCRAEATAEVLWNAALSVVNAKRKGLLPVFSFCYYLYLGYDGLFPSCWECLLLFWFPLSPWRDSAQPYLWEEHSFCRCINYVKQCFNYEIFIAGIIHKPSLKE